VADCGGFHRAAERLNLTQPIDDRLARLQLTTLNLNLFGSPTRSDYRFVIRSGRLMEKARQFWNSQSQFSPEMRWASGDFRRD
jgi:hypothetical protein